MDSEFIYLDNNSTTPVDPKVMESMIPYMREHYANASSNHAMGQIALNAIDDSKCKIADLIHCDPNEIIFTSGSTESINIILKGVSSSLTQKGSHIITVKSEHKAVIDTCQYLEDIGCEITYLDVDEYGMINLDDLNNSIRHDTILVCIMWANNETGVIQDIESIAQVCRQKETLLFTDATQAFGKISINLERSDIDFLCFSGHKAYGPKGVGGLYVKESANHMLSPLIHGGGHQKNLRSGTLNVPGIVGLGKAAEIAGITMKEDVERIKEMRDYLELRLSSLDDTRVNGGNSRLFNTSNITFKGVEADFLIEGLKGIAFSNGSACSSALLEPSHVLRSMGLSDADAFSSIRFSLGRFNTMEEITRSVDLISSSVKNFRKQKMEVANHG
ncbi:MAG: cysteine desulfurase family protein [Bacteroidota bacterium]